MAKPFFKWAGGKANLVPQLLPLLPADYAERRHVEPFLGGGALFYALEPKRAVLSDANAALVETHRLVRDNPEFVIRSLRRLIKTHSREMFYKRRDRFNRRSGHPRERVPLFLYLNKTCFNGLYRENRYGDFNVPCGDYKELNVDADGIREASRVLAAASGVLLQPSGYGYCMDCVVHAGDFVYLDPPYDDGYTSYVKEGFNAEAQIDLANSFIRCADKTNVKLMLSNADTAFIRVLYKGFNITKVDAARSVAANGTKRKRVSELVIRNYE